MGGKASLYMVLGFSLIFMVAGYNYGLLTNNAVDNNMNYYAETVAHNIAVSGANIAANQVFIDKNWNAGYSNVAFGNGYYDVKVEKTGINNIKITATGTYQKITKKVEILLQPSSFAKFAYYMNIFPGSTFLNTGDTITGPFHTQGKLNVQGTPVFQGKASAKNGLKLSNGATPKFYGGFESGVDIPIDWDVSATRDAALAGGHVFNPSGTGQMDVRLTFNSDASVTYSYSTNNGGTWSPDSTKPLKTFAPNGVIYIEKGNAYIKGTINGSYTLFVDQSSGTATGNVFIEGDVLYKNNPLKDPTSKDMLGIVCSNNILISDNAANRNNVEIDASIFTYKGGLGLVNENMPDSGTLRVLGGIVEYQARTTGKVNSTNKIISGYRERIIFDERLMLSSPNYFPVTDKYEVVSWLE
ncbi:MAG: hypothetical protein ACM34K_05805 [Bacillota bacterium]